MEPEAYSAQHLCFTPLFFSAGGLTITFSTVYLHTPFCTPTTSSPAGVDIRYIWKDCLLFNSGRAETSAAEDNNRRESIYILLLITIWDSFFVFWSYPEKEAFFMVYNKRTNPPSVAQNSPCVLNPSMSKHSAIRGTSFISKMWLWERNETIKWRFNRQRRLSSFNVPAAAGAPRSSNSL